MAVQDEIPGAAAEPASIPVSIAVLIPVQADWARGAIPAGVWTLFAAVERALIPAPDDWVAVRVLLPALVLRALVSLLALGDLVLAWLLVLADLVLALLPELVFLVADECRLPVWVVALPRAWVCLVRGGFPVLDVLLPAFPLVLVRAQGEHPPRALPERFFRRSSAGSRPPSAGDHGSGWRTARDSASLSDAPYAAPAGEPHGAHSALPSAPAWVDNSDRRGRR